MRNSIRGFLLVAAAAALVTLAPGERAFAQSAGLYVNSVDLDIYWPNGLHEQYKKLTTKQLVTIREGSGIVSNKGWSRS